MLLLLLLDPPLLFLSPNEDKVPIVLSLLLLMRDVIAAATATLNLGSEAMVDTSPNCGPLWVSSLAPGKLLIGLFDVQESPWDGPAKDVRSRTMPLEGSLGFKGWKVVVWLW